MSVCIALRDDYDGFQLRELARASCDPRQVRRLLALAAAYDGMSRADAAKVGGMGRQTLRDWAHRFNEEGPDGLTRAPDLNLIAAVALGRKWFTDIRDGRARSVSDIVKRAQVNQGDVSRMIPLGLLAPDIVEAILDPVGRGKGIHRLHRTVSASCPSPL
jgi:hypothetical protein